MSWCLFLEQVIVPGFPCLAAGRYWQRAVELSFNLYSSSMRCCDWMLLRLNSAGCRCERRSCDRGIILLCRVQLAVAHWALVDGKLRVTLLRCRPHLQAGAPVRRVCVSTALACIAAVSYGWIARCAGPIRYLGYRALRKINSSTQRLRISHLEVRTALVNVGEDSIGLYDARTQEVIFTCAQKLTASQLNLPHGSKSRKIKKWTKTTDWITDVS